MGWHKTNAPLARHDTDTTRHGHVLPVHLFSMVSHFPYLGHLQRWLHIHICRFTTLDLSIGPLLPLLSFSFSPTESGGGKEGEWLGGLLFRLTVVRLSVMCLPVDTQDRSHLGSSGRKAGSRPGVSTAWLGRHAARGRVGSINFFSFVSRAGDLARLYIRNGPYVASLPSNKLRGLCTYDPDTTRQGNVTARSNISIF